MTNASDNGYHTPSTRMDDILNTVTTQSQNIGSILSTLYTESSRRQVVIRNLEDAVVLEVPLNGVIVGGVILTAMMRLRWVAVLALLTLFGRFYMTIEYIDEADDADQADEQATEATDVAPKRTRRKSAKTQRLGA